MLAKEITSLQHPFVKHWVKLRENRSYRKQNKTVLVSGLKVIREICQELKPIHLLLEKDTPAPFPLPIAPILVNDAIIKKVTGVKTPEPIVAEFPLPKEADLVGKKRILVLDGISDPGNLGTILRTALALGWDGAFILPSVTDPYNEKALRAAKGATFKLPLQFGTYEDLKQLQVHYYVADSRGKPLEEEKLQFPLALVLGNEAHGADNFIKNISTSICIPINDQMESLNVAIAGGILMHTMGQRS